MRRQAAAMLGLALFAAGASSAGAGRALDDLMMDMQIAPVDSQATPALIGTTLDGARVSLADLKGQAVLVYFWATW